MNRKEIFFQDKEMCTIPFTHVIEDEFDSSLNTVDELYGAADVLSIQNAQKHKRILWLIAMIGTIITFSFLLYDEAELHGLILACVVMIIFLFVIHKMANRLESHRKYLEYRVLAETLRVQFFISIAGINKSVNAILPWFIKSSIPWIEEILLTLPSISISEKKSILDYWIRDQLAYHKSALIRAKAKKVKDNRTTNIALVITIIVYIIALLFEIHVYNGFSVGMSHNVIRALLKIALGSMSALTLFLGNYYGKLSLSYIIDDHKRMIILYENAEKEVLQKGETEELLLFLAHEFLIENSTWYAYQSKNKPSIVMG